MVVVQMLDNNNDPNDSLTKQCKNSMYGVPLTIHSVRKHIKKFYIISTFDEMIITKQIHFILLLFCESKITNP